MMPRRKIAYQRRMLVREAKNAKAVEAKDAQNRNYFLNDHLFGFNKMDPSKREKMLNEMGATSTVQNGFHLIAFPKPKGKKMVLTPAELAALQNPYAGKRTLAKARLKVLMKNQLFLKRYGRMVEEHLNQLPRFKGDALGTSNLELKFMITAAFSNSLIPTDQIGTIIRSARFRNWLDKNNPRDPIVAQNKRFEELKKLLSQWKPVRLTPQGRKKMEAVKKYIRKHPLISI